MKLMANHDELRIMWWGGGGGGGGRKRKRKSADTHLGSFRAKIVSSAVLAQKHFPKEADIKQI